MSYARYKIFYPVDFSTHSVLAAMCVKTWIDRLDAALDTVHVMDTSALAMEPDYELRHLTERRMADPKHYSDRYFGKNVASCTALMGDIADEIEYLAQREEVDLIMLRRGHQNLLTRYFHNSLTATLLERSTALVRTTEHIDEMPTLPSSILRAVDFERNESFNAKDDRMLQAVRLLVSRFRASLVFLHIVRQHRDLHEGGTDPEDIEIESWKMRAQEFFGNSITVLRKSGGVTTAISDTAKHLGIDLIVIGRTRPRKLSLELQTRVLRIDHATHRPVLSVWCPQCLIDKPLSKRG